MPVGFWGDADGQRYRDSYFDTWPGIWRHGDFFRVNARGGCFVLGRSDATLNRHGVRIGTAEIYRVAARRPEVEDSLIVNLDLPGRRFFMPLFVKLKGDSRLTEDVESRIRAASASEYSPAPRAGPRSSRCTAIPYTLTGKKMEVPVRRILMGVPVDKAVDRESMANPEVLEAFIAYARSRSTDQGAT